MATRHLPEMKNNLLTLFGLGKTIFSATSASMVGIVFYMAFARTGVQSPYVYLGFIGLIFGISIWLLSIHTKHAELDAREIVIDEFIGMFLCLFIAGTTNTLQIGGLFVAFRLIDIYKPFPFQLIGQKMKNGWGVMLDDLVIGAVIGIAYKLIIPSFTA